MDTSAVIELERRQQQLLTILSPLTERERFEAGKNHGATVIRRMANQSWRYACGYVMEFVEVSAKIECQVLNPYDRGMIAAFDRFLGFRPVPTKHLAADDATDGGDE